MKDFWMSKIPERIRKAFYGLPLFIQWYPGLIWEEKGNRRNAEYGFALFIGFFLVTGTLYLFENAIGGLFPVTAYAISWIAFVLHTLLSIVYLGVSGFIVYHTWKGNSPTISQLDDLFKKFARLFFGQVD